MPIYRPQWLLELEEESDPMDRQTRLVRNRYLLKSAALACAPMGDMKALSKLTGIPYPTLAGTFKAEHPMITPALAIRIEKAVGKAVLPRNYLRPDIFE